MLHLLDKAEEIRRCYARLDGALAGDGRLRFYYISALRDLGEWEEALALLEADGGLVMDDIREGEDSIGQLYTSLQEKVTGRPVPVPDRYDFNAL